MQNAFSTSVVKILFAAGLAVYLASAIPASAQQESASAANQADINKQPLDRINENELESEVKQLKQQPVAAAAPTPASAPAPEPPPVGCRLSRGWQ